MKVARALVVILLYAFFAGAVGGAIVVSYRLVTWFAGVR